MRRESRRFSLGGTDFRRIVRQAAITSVGAASAYVLGDVVPALDVGPQLQMAIGVFAATGFDMALRFLREEDGTEDLSPAGLLRGD